MQATPSKTGSVYSGCRHTAVHRLTGISLLNEQLLFEVAASWAKRQVVES